MNYLSDGPRKGVGGHWYQPNKHGQYVWRAYAGARAWDRRKKGKHGRRETARERRAVMRARRRTLDRLTKMVTVMRARRRTRDRLTKMEVTW